MNRRNFLQSSAAAAVGASCLSEAAETSRQKYLFVVEGNGLPQRQIHPPNVPFIPLGERGEFQEFKITDLPPALQPVSDYMDKMCIVQGITGRMCGGHSNDHGTLGSFNARDGRLIMGPTIDYLLGQQSGDRVFENVVLGINGNNKDVVFNLSASAKDKPIATLCNPVAAYNRLYGALGNKEEVAHDKALIDYLVRDIERTEQRLGKPDEKLQKYADAFRNIDSRNDRIGGLQLTNVPQLTDKYRSLDHVDMLDAHFEMAAAALRGNLTDSATLAVGVGYEHMFIEMTSLEGVEMARHNLGHANMKHTNPAEPHAGHEEAARVRKYVFELIARALEEVDNLVVVYTSDAAEKHHSQCIEWPHVILGNHPNLQLDGRFLYYPEDGTDQQKTLNVLHNTLLRAGGIELDEFGQLVKTLPREKQIGILPELLA